MVIAVYANLKGYSLADPYPRFVKALVEQLAGANSDHSFYWIKEEATDFKSSLPNLYTSFIKPPFKLFYQYSLSNKINHQIKKLKADAMFSIDTVINSKVRQCVLIGNINQKNQGAEFSKLSTVFCLSEKVKSELMDHYAVDGATINMVYGGSSIDFLPLNENEKSAVKESHTDGKEYFLYRGAFHSSNIIQLLKAFSIFKKRQKSTMKMVLLGSIKPGDKEFPVLINTYKYRDDIIVVNGEDEHTEKELTGAAYAYVQPYRSNSLCFVFDAMQNNIPSLIDASSPLIEIDSEAALCFDTHSAEDIADVLMRIYKDERLYGDVVAKGQELIAKDYKGETLNRIWNSLFQVKED